MADVLITQPGHTPAQRVIERLERIEIAIRDEAQRKASGKGDPRAQRLREYRDEIHRIVPGSHMAPTPLLQRLEPILKEAERLEAKAARTAGSAPIGLWQRIVDWAR